MAEGTAEGVSMNKVFITNAVISKGYDTAPALIFSESGDSVRFKIGYKVYDSREENNTRWVNIRVKAHKDLADRIKKMKLKEGSSINLSGNLDEDVWEDSATHERKSAMVIYLTEIEYTSGGSSKTNKDPEEDEADAAAPKKDAEKPKNFKGYEAPADGGFF